MDASLKVFVFYFNGMTLFLPQNDYGYPWLDFNLICCHCFLDLLRKKLLSLESLKLECLRSVNTDL